jgi:hypothetical protein
VIIGAEVCGFSFRLGAVVDQPNPVHDVVSVQHQLHVAQNW